MATVFEDFLMFVSRTPFAGLLFLALATFFLTSRRVFAAIAAVLVAFFVYDYSQLQKQDDAYAELSDTLGSLTTQLEELVHATDCRYDLFGSASAVVCPSPFACVRERYSEADYQSIVGRHFELATEDTSIHDLAWSVLVDNIATHYDCVRQWAHEHHSMANATRAAAVGARILAEFDHIGSFSAVIESINATAPECMASYSTLYGAVFGGTLVWHEHTLSSNLSPAIMDGAVDNTRLFMVQEIHAQFSIACMFEARLRGLARAPATPNWCRQAQDLDLREARRCKITDLVPDTN
jgi:hypothetical protein